MIFDWIRNYKMKKRRKIIESLTQDEIMGIRMYAEAIGDMTSLRARNSKLSMANLELERKVSHLEGSFREAGLMAERFQKQYADAARQLEEERVRNETIANVTAQKKDEEYSVKILQLENGREGLLEKIKEATKNYDELERKYADVINENKYLAESKKRAVIENALTRMGKGEKPEDFNCNDISGELARRYASAQVDIGDISEERDKLKRMLGEASSGYYETVFDILEAKGEFKGHYSLLYVDNHRNLSRVSKNIGEFLGYKTEEIKGKPLGMITKKILSRDIRRILTSDWRGEKEEFREVALIEGKKLDVLVQRVNDYDASPTGAFVYLSKHNMFRVHRSHKRVLYTIGKIGQNLINIYQ